MSKKTHWKEWANNSLESWNNTTKEQKERYKRKMFKLGLALDKMPINKPKIQFVQPSKDKDNE